MPRQSHLIIALWLVKRRLLGQWSAGAWGWYVPGSDDRRHEALSKEHLSTTSERRRAEMGVPAVLLCFFLWH